MRRRQRRRAAGVQVLVLAFVGLVAEATTSVAEAQPSREDIAEAQELFGQGEQAYRVGNYDEAVSLWRRAYALDPRPRIQYNLSQAYERLGQLQEAVEALDAYIRATPPDEPLYGEANARLSALRQRVALTGVRIVGGPVGAQIFIDQQAWGATPRPDRIPLTPGTHRVEIIFPNGARHEIAVAVPVGQVVDVTVPSGASTEPVLRAEDPVTPAPRTGPVYTPPPEDPRDRHLLFWSGAGVAAAGVGVFVYGITRQVELSGCDDPGFACLEESTVQRQRTLGFVMGGTLLAAGATLIVIDLMSTRASDRADVRLGLGLASLSLTVHR